MHPAEVVIYRFSDLFLVSEELHSDDAGIAGRNMLDQLRSLQRENDWSPFG